MLDLRTPIEKARDERNKNICEYFLKCSNEMPDCAPHRIFRLVAEKFCMTVPGIKNIVVANGLYQPQKNKPFR